MEPPQQLEVAAQSHEAPLAKILMVASIGIGLQFLGALQMSLLTPYVQLLGIPHKWSALVWLCGPISIMVVQPIVGYYSDNCTSRFGRRRPYIAAGTAFVVIAVFLISFAADIGHATGDSLGKSVKPRAIIVFIIGFWVLDAANTMLQGPCRALLGDLSGTNSSKMRTSNAAFVFSLSVGCVLGFAASSYSKLHKMFPFAMTKACDVNCANLKSCFFISIIILISLTTLALTFVKEDKNPTNNFETRTKVPSFLGGIISAVKDLPREMWILVLVTSMCQFAWTPFLMFGTDWMGREVYGGNVEEKKLYVQGGHAGSLGLMIQAGMVGVTALAIGFLARRLRCGVKKLWVVAMLFLAICMFLTVLITKTAEASRRYTTTSDGKVITLPPDVSVKAGAIALISVMGFPLAVTQCVPFTLVPIYSRKSKAGLGLSMGTLSSASTISPLIVSLLIGPWDALFGGSNLPGFIVGAFAAAASAIVALALLPSPPPDTPLDNTSTVEVGTHH